MKRLAEWVYYFQVFLTSTLVEGEKSASCPGRFTPGTHWIGGRVNPVTGLEGMEKGQFLPLLGLELLPVASRYTDCDIRTPK
jgi:hypothetical protein